MTYNRIGISFIVAGLLWLGNISLLVIPVSANRSNKTPDWPCVAGIAWEVRNGPFPARKVTKGDAFVLANQLLFGSSRIKTTTIVNASSYSSDEHVSLDDNMTAILIRPSTSVASAEQSAARKAAQDAAAYARSASTVANRIRKIAKSNKVAQRYPKGVIDFMAPDITQAAVKTAATAATATADAADAAAKAAAAATVTAGEISPAAAARAAFTARQAAAMAQVAAETSFAAAARAIATARSIDNSTDQSATKRLVDMVKTAVQTALQAQTRAAEAVDRAFAAARSAQLFTPSYEATFVRWRGTCNSPEARPGDVFLAKSVGTGGPGDTQFIIEAE